VGAELNEEWCYEVLRRTRWLNGIVCPRCGKRRVTTHSRSTGTPWRRYLCLGCRRTFTDLTGTPLARTNLPLTTWFQCLRLMGEGRSTSGLAKELRVKWDTSVQLQRRLAAGLTRPGLLRQLREAAREAWGA
jgi:transposase-like protein